LIELLVVVLILAILMAVALPLYLSAVADSEKKTCRANMQTVANAVQAYRVKTRNSAAVPTMAQLLPDLGAAPICPKSNTNTYTIALVGAGPSFNVTCPDNANTAHGSFEPGVDGS